MNGGGTRLIGTVLAAETATKFCALPIVMIVAAEKTLLAVARTFLIESD